ncbi:phospho-sugar mutase [Candidatus Soleaferrea massiliensis]|uniref:phospho-sugar mutase n=1 Tax=Candidatus Soleaferrea massiliensis TaxID=1470354 RepID=UPI000694B978|nr:phospho-sugar mutase [Candidatus Soleaferrea massiliensis]
MILKEQQLYDRWLQYQLEDKDLTDELNEITGREEEIVDRFYRDLEFGTGGLRGVIGAGTNRMNIYTIRRATQGLADYLNEDYKTACVAISYDSRIKSDRFAREAACVLAANGIKAYLYKELMPTPALSFAVRELGCQAGIMVTASHNPAKYNGYKAYGADGCQMTLEIAERVLTLINRLDIFEDVKTMDFEEAIQKGLIAYIPDEVTEKFIQHVLGEAINPGICEKAGLKVVYTPLNGTGNKPVRETLRRMGIRDVTVVPEQEYPDGNFPTCPFPNPEIREALQKGLELCDKVQPDLLLATDPDCDRVGIAVNQNGEYILMSGNEVGALLLQYIASCRIQNGTMPKNPIAVKTIVTSNIIEAIAKDYGVQVINVLTGFKFIGEQIALLEEKGEQNRYIFGFEESYGYLSGTYVRDKDAVNGAALICEMAAYYKSQGKTLVDVLNEIYAKYGNYLHVQGNFTCEGVTGMQRMNDIMESLRKNPPAVIGGLEVLRFADYETSVMKDLKSGETSEIKLPKSNVLQFDLQDEAGVIIRPSGTEPKIKVYYTTKCDTKEAAAKLQEQLAVDMTKLMGF